MGENLRRCLLSKSTILDDSSLGSVLNPAGQTSQLKVGPATAIVITSAAAVKELMDKRSASTADRPPHNMADVVTGGSNMVLARYCKKGSLDAGGYSDPDMILLKRTCGECFARMPI